MATDQSAAPGSQPSAQVVGNAFVQQFYHILHTSPELVYRFYQESSKLSRPDPDGVMKTVSSMQAINEKILAMDYSELKAEIKTVDAQESLESGVIVMVTGYLTGKDLVKKDFTQSFFLAPQDKGFYVLNDLFRYVDENVEHIEKLDLPNGTAEDLSLEQVSPAPQEEIIQEQLPPSSIEEENDEEENDEEVYNPPQNEVEHAVTEEEIPVEEVINEIPPVSEVVTEAIPVPAVVTGEAPKKSYASIVQLMKANPAPLSAPPPVVASKVSWVAAASVGAVAALKDQAGLCRWNHVFRSLHKHGKNNLGSVSKANGSRTLSLVERLREDKGKESEESLRTIMYLSCWGPN